MNRFLRWIAVFLLLSAALLLKSYDRDDKSPAKFVVGDCLIQKESPEKWYTGDYRVVQVGNANYLTMSILSDSYREIKFEDQYLWSKADCP